MPGQPGEPPRDLPPPHTQSTHTEAGFLIMPDITVYGSPGCQQCKATERWLESRGHEYTYVHLEEFPDAAERLRARGHVTMPIVTVTRPDGGTAEWSGFRPSVLETALGGAA